MLRLIMFYVIGLDGEPVPYDPEMVELMRQVRVQQPPEQPASAAPGAGTEADPGAAAIGTAGAGASYRSRGASGANSPGVGGKLKQRRLPTASDETFEVHPGEPSEAVPARKLEEEPEESYSHSRSKLPKAYEKLGETPAKREQALLAEQLMSSPVKTINAELPLQEALKLIRRERFRHIPVVSETDKLIGILSDRSFLTSSAGLTEDALKGKVVRNLMATNVLTARPDTEIRAIAKILFEERIGAMPIVNDQTELVGILTRSDILRALISKAPLEMWI